MHIKQIERLVKKIERITSVYQSLLIDDEIRINDVYLNGKRIKENEKWGSEGEYGVFKFSVSRLDTNKKYYLFSLTGATEQLIKVNSKEVGLIDYVKDAEDSASRIHKYVLLDNIKQGDVIEIEAYYSHTFPGTFPYNKDKTYGLNNVNYNRVFEYISLVTMDEDLKELVYSLSYLNDLYSVSTTNKQKQFYTEIYIELFKTLPLKEERLDKESIDKALSILDRAKNPKKEDILPYVGVIGHSHLDTAWLWTVNETRHKLHRTISNAVTLCKRHKDYKFFFSTVLYLKWLKEDDINLYNDVVELIKNGQIEANGASFIEFDSNLIGNESICRQFLRGKTFVKNETGYDPDVFWLPDTFGYAASLPQILKETNIKYFLTTKLSWNDTNTFPYDTFNWIGIDGSTVPVHFTSIHTWLDPIVINNRLNNVIDKTTTTDVLITYGFGDGGGGPSEEMVKKAIDTIKNYKDAIVEHVTVSHFMDKLNKDKLPSYFGELYLELHRGTYTSIHDIKKYHKMLEVALHNYELIGVLSNTYNKERVEEYYDILMLNEFHDILPGTCIKEQNDITVKQLKDTINNIYKEIVSSRGKYFNPLFNSRTAYLESRTGQEYTNLDGETKHISLYKFNGNGYGKIIKSSGNLKATDTEFETKYYKGKISNGLITSLLFDGIELVEGLFGYYKVAQNYPLTYDNWDIDKDYIFKEQDTTFVKQELVSVGESMIVYRVTYKFYNSFIYTDIILYSDSPLIEYKTKLDIKDDSLLLRTYFDTSVFNKTYSSEIQFGYLDRNAYNSGYVDEAKFETCSHKWIDLSDGSYGLSLLKKDLYGTSCLGKRIGLTLHKGGTHPDKTSDKGIHYLNFALYPHKNGLSMDIVNKAYEFNYEPIRTFNNDIIPLFNIIKNDSIVIETVKQAENRGIVLRLYEALGRRSNIEIEFNKAFEFHETNILEIEKGKISDGKSLKLEFKPFEIKTILIIEKEA